MMGGGSIDRAEIFIEDFIDSRIDLAPVIKGQLLYHKGEGNIKRQVLKYFVLRPQYGDILSASDKD